MRTPILRTVLLISVHFRRSVVKMAAQKSVPSDLYKCVYSFLLDNKFTKAAQQFLKQTKVVRRSFSVVDSPLGVLSVPRCLDVNLLNVKQTVWETCTHVCTWCC